MTVFGHEAKNRERQTMAASARWKIDLSKYFLITHSRIVLFSIEHSTTSIYSKSKVNMLARRIELLWRNDPKGNYFVWCSAYYLLHHMYVRHGCKHRFLISKQGLLELHAHTHTQTRSEQSQWQEKLYAGNVHSSGGFVLFFLPSISIIIAVIKEHSLVMRFTLANWRILTINFWFMAFNHAHTLHMHILAQLCKSRPISLFFDNNDTKSKTVLHSLECVGKFWADAGFSSVN